MTLFELLDSLSISLHDANLRSFQMDYVHRRLTLDVEVCIGEPEVEDRRVVYRPAILMINEVSFLYVEPPCDTDELHIGSSIRIDAGEIDPADVKDPLLQHLRHIGPFTHIFLRELSSSIYFAAGSASMEWTGSEDNRTEAINKLYERR